MAEQDEQLEAFKRWWKKNWASLAMSIGLALLIVAGWQYWQVQQEAERAAARQGFETLVGALSQADEAERQATLEFALDRLRSDHPNSVYAIYGAMIGASFYMEEGKPEQAAEQLQWALEHVGEEPLPLVVRERLARAQFAAGDKEGALATLEGARAKGKFEPLFHELAGDIHLAKGNKEAARKSYKAAQASMDDDHMDRLLELKLADLAVPEED